MWFVVHTKPREERKALENLSAQGFEAFLPMLTREKLLGGRLKTITEPLFSRYLFVSTESDNQNFSLIRSTKGVHQLLSFGLRPSRVSNSLIEALLQLRTEEVFDRLLKPGDSIKVVDGPLSGLQGVFVSHDGQERARILIEILCNCHEIEISRHDLAPLSGS